MLRYPMQAVVAPSGGGSEEHLSIYTNLLAANSLVKLLQNKYVFRIFTDVLHMVYTEIKRKI